MKKNMEKLETWRPTRNQTPKSGYLEIPIRLFNMHVATLLCVCVCVCELLLLLSCFIETLVQFTFIVKRCPSETRWQCFC